MGRRPRGPPPDSAKSNETREDGGETPLSEKGRVVPHRPSGVSLLFPFLLYPRRDPERVGGGPLLFDRPFLTRSDLRGDLHVRP